MIAVIFDNAALLTNPRRNLKNYSCFNMIYIMSAKTSSDPKIHYELNNLFVETYIKIDDDIDHSLTS